MGYLWILIPINPPIDIDIHTYLSSLFKSNMFTKLEDCNLFFFTFCFSSEVDPLFWTQSMDSSTCRMVRASMMRTRTWMATGNSVSLRVQVTNSFFPRFFGIVKSVFSFLGGPILSGVLPTFFASVSSFLQIWVLDNLKRFCSKVWYILHLTMTYLQTIIPFIDPMDRSMVCWIRRGAKTERREFLKSFLFFFPESTDSYRYLFLETLETGLTHTIYLLTDKLERFPDRFLAHFSLWIWGPAFFSFFSELPIFEKPICNTSWTKIWRGIESYNYR